MSTLLNDLIPYITIHPHRSPNGVGVTLANDAVTISDEQTKAAKVQLLRLRF